MTIYVDSSIFPYRNTLYCHMMSGLDDTDLSELHAFAQQIGLKRCWFQNKERFPHYDLAPSRRKLAVAQGTIEVECSDLVKMCKRVIKSLDKQSDI